MAAQETNTEYRQLGHSGVRVSTVGLGANRFSSAKVTQAEVTRIIGTALDLGVSLIGTANVYQCSRSEEDAGRGVEGP